MKNFFLLLVVLITTTTFAFADGIDFPPSAPGDTNGTDPIPVDGGATALIIAGGAYAMKRLKSAKANKVATKA